MARSLLDVLDLLSQSFDMGLELDDKVRDVRVAALRSDGVRLAEELLGEEVELAAHGSSTVEERAELFEVTLETSDLLGDVEAIAKE